MKLSDSREATRVMRPESGRGVGEGIGDSYFGENELVAGRCSAIQEDSDNFHLVLSKRTNKQ